MPTALLAQVIVAACLRAGAERIPVNPAYTSMIGVKYEGYGYSSHHGAAVVIARRAIGFSCSKKGERVAFRDSCLPRLRVLFSSAASTDLAHGDATPPGLGDLKRKARVAPQAIGRFWKTHTGKDFLQEAASSRPAPGISLRQREATRNRTRGDIATIPIRNNTL